MSLFSLWSLRNPAKQRKLAPGCTTPVTSVPNGPVALLRTDYRANLYLVNFFLKIWQSPDMLKVSANICFLVACLVTHKYALCALHQNTTDGQYA